MFWEIFNNCWSTQSETLDVSEGKKVRFALMFQSKVVKKRDTPQQTDKQDR
jgi:hypothetical protein